MTVEMFSLAGKTALVTGASRGMGAAIALGLATAGADVAVTARSESDLRATAAAITDAGRRALAVAGDVTVAADVDAVVGQVIRDFGQIDILVNNAGGPLFNAAFLDMRPEGWSRLIDLNLTSVASCCRAVGAHMVERGSGTIINMGSPATLRPWPAIAAYSAAKAAVLNLTQVLAQEWARAGVRVNIISPGWIKTDVNEAFATNDRASAQICNDVPLGRWGRVDDILGAAIWLASDAAGYVTGAHIAIDGGLTAAVPEDWRSLRVRRDWSSQERPPGPTA
jgi:NAD(P)-dependent dehydrogenase (short-subunit alcohol dehydrogenase family)